jgi:hypothetical protein
VVKKKIHQTVPIHTSCSPHHYLSLTEKSSGHQQEIYNHFSRKKVSLARVARKQQQQQQQQQVIAVLLLFSSPLTPTLSFSNQEPLYTYP